MIYLFLFMRKKGKYILAEQRLVFGFGESCGDVFKGSELNKEQKRQEIITSAEEQLKKAKMNFKLGQLEKTQDKKMESQKEDFERFERLGRELEESAKEILEIAEDAEDPEKAILQAVEEYAQQEKIPILAAKVKVLQYLSPEWKEKVSAEVREYLINNDILAIKKLPEGDQRREEYKANIIALKEEGFIDYYTIVIHYAGNKEKQNQKLIEHEKFVKKTFAELKEEKKKPFKDKEKVVLDNENIFPEAKKYLRKLNPKKIYERAIEIAFQNIVVGRKIDEFYYNYTLPKEDRFDCDEETLMLQKLETEGGLQIGDYINRLGHVSLKLDSLPLVLDTYDMKIRSITEFAKKEGYPKEYHGSYYWRDRDNHYLAEYEEGDDYPKKIIDYRQVKEHPYLVMKNENISGLLIELADNRKDKDLFKLILEINPNDADVHSNYASLLTEEGDKAGAKLHYEAALRINPNNAEAHYNYANLLDEEGDKAGVKLHYEAALRINPNYAKAHNNYANLLNEEGDKAGAKLHYEAALRINPNYAKAHYNYAILLDGEGNYKDVRLHLEAYKNILGKEDEYYKNFDQGLKNKGF